MPRTPCTAKRARGLSQVARAALEEGMRLIDTLKQRLSAYHVALGAAVLLGAFGTYAFQQLSADCCKPGASCCYDGSPCCAGMKHAHK